MQRSQLILYAMTKSAMTAYVSAAVVTPAPSRPIRQIASAKIICAMAPSSRSVHASSGLRRLDDGAASRDSALTKHVPVRRGGQIAARRDQRDTKPKLWPAIARESGREVRSSRIAWQRSYALCEPAAAQNRAPFEPRAGVREAA